MWPFRKKRIVPVFGGLIGALKAKDAALFEVLGHLPAHLFWREWKKAYPEDFPAGRSIGVWRGFDYAETRRRVEQTYRQVRFASRAESKNFQPINADLPLAAPAKGLSPARA